MIMMLVYCTQKSRNSFIMKDRYCVIILVALPRATLGVATDGKAQNERCLCPAGMSKIMCSLRRFGMVAPNLVLSSC